MTAEIVKSCLWPKGKWVFKSWTNELESALSLESSKNNETRQDVLEYIQS